MEQPLRVDLFSIEPELGGATATAVIPTGTVLSIVGGRVTTESADAVTGQQSAHMPLRVELSTVVLFTRPESCPAVLSNEEDGLEPNCVVWQVVVRGLPLPVLVTTRDISVGERLVC